MTLTATEADNGYDIVLNDEIYPSAPMTSHYDCTTEDLQDFPSQDFVAEKGYRLIGGSQWLTDLQSSSLSAAPPVW